MKRSWLLWLTMIIVVVFIPLKVDGQPEPLSFWRQLDALTPTLTAPTSSSQSTNQQQTTADGKQMTPTESIVSDKTLSPTYYYTFASGMTASERSVFQRAVSIYNATGIVKLIPGSAGTSDTAVTFFVYKKHMDKSQQGMIEAGHGGPKIIQRLGVGAYTVNKARAGSNVSYPQYGVKLSVAIHELGHALGLDHSSSRRSVMYPVDQGETALAQSDIRGLKAIYQGE